MYIPLRASAHFAVPDGHRARGGCRGRRNRVLLGFVEVGCVAVDPVDDERFRAEYLGAKPGRASSSTRISRGWTTRRRWESRTVLQRQRAVMFLGIEPGCRAGDRRDRHCVRQRRHPVGAVADSDADTTARIYDLLASRLPHAVRNSDGVPNAVTLYRRLLTQQPDHSVTVVASVPYTNLAAILVSPGGRQLVAGKVKRLVIMDGLFPGGLGPVTNQKLDLDVARPSWPGRCEPVRGRRPSRGSTGSTASVPGSARPCARRSPRHNPMRIAYQSLFGCGPPKDGDWDVPLPSAAVCDRRHPQCLHRCSVAGARP